MQPESKLSEEEKDIKVLVFLIPYRGHRPQFAKLQNLSETLSVTTLSKRLNLNGETTRFRPLSEKLKVINHPIIFEMA